MKMRPKITISLGALTLGVALASVPALAQDSNNPDLTGGGSIGYNRSANLGPVVPFGEIRAAPKALYAFVPGYVAPPVAAGEDSNSPALTGGGSIGFNRGANLGPVVPFSVTPGRPAAGRPLYAVVPGYAAPTGMEGGSPAYNEMLRKDGM